VLLVIAVGNLWATASEGSPRTLKRSFGNILFAPFDLVLSPVVAGRSIHRSLQTTDDSTAVRVLFVVPGFAWNTGVQAMASVVREITGLIEFVPGVCVYFFEADLDPLFAPAERGDALVDKETRPLRIKFGIDYVTVPN
jgi:hypothetical protein